MSHHGRGGGSPVERLFLAVVTPLADAASGFVQGVGGFGDSLRLAGQLRRENQALHTQIADMRRELVRLHGLEEDLERLARLSGYEPASSGSSFVADVVFVDAQSWLRTLIIHTGDERAQANQAVVNDLGLVGRIITVSGDYAKVLLLTDRSAAASAMIKRTRRQGLARGAGPGGLLLDNLPASSDVRVGDRVVTAGLDGVFPRGLPIGVVSGVRPEEDLFHAVEVAPAVDFGLLDQVYVLIDGPLPDQVRSDFLSAEGADGAP